ncbi:MAG TPA: 2-amino-4-hydroxy-6-hydroxymethyldihydropteridine diphosphokinase [Ferrovibrio sp.]|uniref:2-amino-4-hydroxy-6- hydroxymethyldihydropteridine diphosphokinase n=1 Tax=Ferrovibrio sp. TaxID=1917215 RepID=UPI002ED662FA
MNGIYIALGANLPSVHGAPRETLEAALAALAKRGVAILQRSSWWRSAPQPASAQPDFINGAAEIATALAPRDLLSLLHQVEADFGRVRGERWAARVLDIDLLDYRGIRTDEEGICLPHPRLQDRLFVLLPLQEIAPAWRHPVSGETLDDLLYRANPLKINKL